jgi:hypothetical protein
MMKRVYFASKLSEADRWRWLCKRRSDIIAHARWLKHEEIGTPDDSCHAPVFWRENEDDIDTADALVVYATEGQHLCGALVEVGIAIGVETPVYVVGDHPDYGTWCYHPGVTRVKTIDEALDLIVKP